jgi:hypothetical protein
LRPWQPATSSGRHENQAAVHQPCEQAIYLLLTHRQTCCHKKPLHENYQFFLLICFIVPQVIIFATKIFMKQCIYVSL